MVEHGRRTVVATFYEPGPFGVGTVATLGADAAHHMRVRRLASGARIGLVNGRGNTGGGILTRLGRFDAEVALDETWDTPRPPEVNLVLPIADRDRMLWLAEKAVELSVSRWQAVMWHRSHSVSVRGEGPRFDDKVRARMISALEQSGGAWLPDMFTDISIDSAAAAAVPGTRLFLDRDGVPLLGALGPVPVTIMVGPEGGPEPDERAMLIARGFQPVSLGDTILRFETAAVAALSTVRAALQHAAAVNPR